MSGVAEGIAGLTLSAVSVASLFTACIDCFNIVIKAREFGQDYEVLCADLALQRLRFCLWGEAVGLTSRDASSIPVRNPGLDDPAIQPTLAQTLQAIQWLLTQADASKDRFALPSRGSSSKGLSLFRSTFDRFRTRARENQTQQSVIGVTTWAIYAGDKFQEKIEQLKSLIDGLESVTKSLGVLDVQRSRIHEEINSLDDVLSLRLLRDASLNSQYDVSDTASRRIMMIEGGSIAERSGIPYSGSTNTGNSFYTAEEGIKSAIQPNPSSLVDELLEQMEESTALSELLDRMQESTSFNELLERMKEPAIWSQFLEQIKELMTWSEFLEQIKESSTWSKLVLNNPNTAQNRRILAQVLRNAPKLPPWKAGSKTDEYGSKLTAFNIKNMVCSGIFPSSLAYLPEKLINRKLSTDNPWDKFLVQDALPYNQQRVSRDLKDFKNGPPWIAAAQTYYEPLHLLAAIEGPPDTPYEGGVFFIDVHIPPWYPAVPPHMQFLTRIYHPNIDSRGNICLDMLQDNWSPAFSFSSVLIALCSILSDPNLEDPLVPEIAQIYCEDYGLYCRYARTSTSRYAVAEPTETEIIAEGWQ